VLLIGTLFLYPLLAPPPHRIDEAHFQLINEGMTEAEVEAIFGVPAGSYEFARPNMEFVYWLELASAMEGRVVQKKLVQRKEYWSSRHGGSAVSFDVHGRVVSKLNTGDTRVEFPWQGWWQKLTRK